MYALSSRFLQQEIPGLFSASLENDFKIIRCNKVEIHKHNLKPWVESIYTSHIGPSQIQGQAQSHCGKILTTTGGQARKIGAVCAANLPAACEE